jgi:hypothetical protein
MPKLFLKLIKNTKTNIPPNIQLLINNVFLTFSKVPFYWPLDENPSVRISRWGDEHRINLIFTIGTTLHSLTLKWNETKYFISILEQFLFYLKKYWILWLGFNTFDRYDNTWIIFTPFYSVSCFHVLRFKLFVRLSVCWLLCYLFPKLS